VKDPKFASHIKLDFEPRGAGKAGMKTLFEKQELTFSHSFLPQGSLDCAVQRQCPLPVGDAGGFYDTATHDAHANMGRTVCFFSSSGGRSGARRLK
jgi:hypothetical protein